MLLFIVNPSSPTEIYTLSLHDALPICDQMSVADLKLINRSVKEMRYAAKVFARFQHFRKVAVFGSARTVPDAPEFKVAEDFGRRSEEHTSELQSPDHLVCRLLLEKQKQ